jgi:hypothetical protein
MAGPVNKTPLRRWERRYLGDERFPDGLSALEIEHFFTLDEQQLAKVSPSEARKAVPQNYSAAV